jgi:hypothetical protein
MDYGAVIVLAGVMVWLIVVVIVKLTNPVIDLIRQRISGDKDTKRRKKDDEREATPAFKDPRSLHTHYFFVSVDTLINTDIKELDCGCPGRSAVVREMARIFVTNWSKTLRDLLDAESSGVIKGENGYNLGHAFFTDLSGWMQKNETGWRQANIPTPAINAFRSWLDPRLDVLRTLTGAVASHPYYANNVSRTAAILSLHELAIRLFILDLMHVVYSLNGRLDGVVYNGQVIQPISELVKKKLESEKAKREESAKFRQAMRTPLPVNPQAKQSRRINTGVASAIEPKTNE